MSGDRETMPMASPGGSSETDERETFGARWAGAFRAGRTLLVGVVLGAVLTGTLTVVLVHPQISKLEQMMRETERRNRELGALNKALGEALERLSAREGELAGEGTEKGGAAANSWEEDVPMYDELELH